MYPIERYRFYRAGNKIIAASTYAKKTVRGVAICDANDEFDFEKGKKLAAARCAVKVAEKRLNRATTMVEDAVDKLDIASSYYDRMCEYRADALEERNKAFESLDRILEDMQ